MNLQKYNKLIYFVELELFLSVRYLENWVLMIKNCLKKYRSYNSIQRSMLYKLLLHAQETYKTKTGNYFLTP